ncbi:MAG: SDR family NAD(P)-dependent oxidoreductase [Desulfobacterales bacterium]
MTLSESVPESAPPVAVIGMSCFFPGAGSLKQYWRLLFHGIDAISDIPESHWSPEDYFDPDPRKPDRIYCKRGGFIPPVPFDPTEFGIPPANLESTDTSQILGLLASRSALEDAGYGNGKPFDRTRTSVVLGVTGTQELVIPLSSRLGYPKWRKALADSGIDPETSDKVVERIAGEYVGWQENSFPGLLGNVVAGRICNRLNLSGTNCVVDAACASSMSAVNLALMELYTRRSDMVITGGVDTLNDIFMHMCFARTQILSPTGDARPFSGDADGTVLGEGVGLLVLKRLADAERDGDRIYALIRGIGASSDGRSQSIYAPRAEGQAIALRKAYDHAGIDPASIALIEAHGTGTRVGDKTEVQGLKTVFGTDGNLTCAIGSVKSMIGHTKAAAGAAGLIKTALALHHKVLPPTLKITEPDPEIGFDQSPFYLNPTSRPWFAGGQSPRRAGVSAFGFGGSNFHVVLEEYRKGRDTVAWDGSVEIVAISGASRDAVAEGLSEWKKCAADDNFAETLAGKAAESRKRFSSSDPFRLLMVLARDRQTDQWNTPAVIADAEAALSAPDGQRFHSQGSAYFGSGDRPGKLAFAFPGQGSQYCGMGRDIVSWFPEAMESMDRANEHFQGDGPLTDIIYPIAASAKDEAAAQEDRLRHTAVAQPALGAASLAMTRVLRRFGVNPDGACGHSYGELAALCAAGWIDETTLHRLSNLRGKLMASAGGGTMAAVKAPLEAIEALIAAEGLNVVLANRNAPNQGVLSGSVEAIEAAEQACKANKMRAIRLQVSAAFHSELVESARAPFADALKDVQFAPNEIPVYSNTTGKAYPTDPDAVSRLLGEHLRNPVRFVDEITQLFADGYRIFLEVGPKTVMKGLVATILKGEDHQALALDASGGKQFGIEDLARGLAHLAALGQGVKLDEWESGATPPPTRKMTVPISGANLKPRSSVPPSRPASGGNNAPAGAGTVLKPPGAPEPAAAKQPNPPQALAVSPPVSDVPAQARDGAAADAHAASGSDGPRVEPETWNAAFAAVEEGLRSLQAIHLQTARTHERFLETQAVTAKTIQELLERTRSMTGLAERRASHGPTLQMNEPAAPTSRPQPAAPPPSRVSPEPRSRPTAPPVTSANPPVETRESRPTSLPPLPPVSAAGTGAVSDTLIAIVSELTGYPKEMLSLDMDMESDLGIDSIKRVEILSAVEERIPGMGTASPETMAELKTLAQVVAILEGSIQPRENPAGSAVPRPVPGAPAGAGAAVEALMAVVSELTGYPIEMLAPEMDIEADLGIDSIKRVEILSAMEERVPGLPAVSPDEMAQLKTLSQIAARLSAQAESEIPDIDAESDDANTDPAPTDLRLKLMEVVSELTGYPVEMLTPDMDIEADLGIDSIKRVEILSAMEEQHPGLPSISPDEMAQLKTLGQIAGYLAGSAGPQRPIDAVTAQHSTEPPSDPDIPLPRTTMRAIPTPFQKRNRLRLPSGKRIFVTTDRSGLSNAISEALSDRGLHTVLVSIDILKHRKSLPEAAGLVLVADPTPPAGDDGLPVLSSGFLKDGFTLIKALGADLTRAGGDSGSAAFLATVSRLDGAFGFNGRPIQDPIQGGLSGILKTAAREWRDVVCRAIDVDPEWKDLRAVAETISDEILFADPAGPVEVGFDRKNRFTLAETTVAYERGTPPELALGNGDVVVITGGARGVTAAAAKAIAALQPLTLVLMGRSPAPVPEPGWLKGISDEPMMKRAILDHEFSGAARPTDVEKAFHRWMANREMTDTLSAIAVAGSTVRYFTADVRDRDKVMAVLKDVQLVHGPVRILLHGAGVLEDRLILDKTAEQFERVLDTKIGGLGNLLAGIDPKELRYLALFSSAAARYGNRGQSDYAAANEVLNKTARAIAQQFPACRVVSFNWGPWDGGMVTGALKREFLRNGTALIPVPAGVDALLHELSAKGGADVEVVVGSGFPPEEAPAVSSTAMTEASPQVIQDPPTSNLSLNFQREIDEKTVPVLTHHKLDGKPVLPFALMAEWFAHSALHDNPGLVLSGIDDMRLLKGVVIDNGSKHIRLMAGKARKSDTGFAVDLELRDGFKNDREIVHSRATAILSDTFPPPPAFVIPPELSDRNYHRPIGDIYRDVLFHGDALQGIRKVEHLGPRGMVALLATAPSPSQWMSDPPRNRWIADPLVLDSAHQMASLWCHEQKGRVSLPSYNAAYRQYRRVYPSESITAVLEIREATERRVKGDFTFLDGEGRVVAAIAGHEAIMDDALIHSFKPNLLAAAG